MRNILFEIFIASVCLIILKNSVNAQIKIYTLNDAIDYALVNNREIKSSLLEIKRAKSAVNEAYGYALPSIDFSAGFSHFLEKMKMPFPDFNALLTNSTYGVLFKEKIIPEDNSKFLPMKTSLQSFSLSNNYDVKFQVTQILFNSAVLNGISSAGIYLDASKIFLKAQISKTVLSVQKAFYSALLMKDMVELINTSYNTFEKAVDNMKKLYDEGFVSEYNYLQMKVQLENFKPKLLEVNNGYKLALDALKLSMSFDKNEQLEIKGEYNTDNINIPELDPSIKKAMRDNLDLNSLDYKMQIDKAFIDIARSEYYPTLAAFGNYTFSGAADDLNFINYRSSMIGLNLSINLFNGGKTLQKVEQQLINVSKTQEQINNVKDALSLNIKAKILDLQRLKENIETTTENVKLAERAFSIADLRLKEGTGTQLELLNAEQAKREAIFNKFKVINDFYNAHFELENLIGSTSEKYLNYFNKDIE